MQLNPDWTTNSCRGSCSIIGNPDLKPETSESFELGLYYRGEEGLLDGVEGSVTTFQNNVDDMIDILRTSSASEAPGYPNFVGWKTVNGKRVPVFRYFNVNKARIKGVETEVAPFGDEWKLTVNYTYNDGRDPATVAINRCNRCRSTPPTGRWTGSRWMTGPSTSPRIIPASSALSAQPRKPRAATPCLISARPGR